MMMKKATPKITPKPTAKATPKATPKPTFTPYPKYTPPTLAEFKKSAAYRTDSMDYREYLNVSEQVYKAKKRKATKPKVK